MEAQRDGEIDPHHDPRILVAMILGGVMAGVTEALSAAPRKPLEETQAAAFAFALRAAGISETEIERHQSTQEEPDDLLEN